MKRLALTGLIAVLTGCTQDQFLAPSQPAKVRATAAPSESARVRRDPVTPESVTEDNAAEKLEELASEMSAASRRKR